MKISYLFLAILATLVALVVPVNVLATTYDVNRSFSSDTLTGTLSIPEGTYTIMGGGASPFTGIDLTLTVGSTPYTLIYGLTGTIWGTGQFLITASSTQLVFNTASANGSSPADFAFSDTFFGSDSYFIGYDANPGFEAVYTAAGNVVNSVSFPVVFGTAETPTGVPEPATMLLLGLGLVGIAGVRRKFKL